MIELFSKEPDYITDVPNGIIPIHVGDDVSSLSAILLDEDYYNYFTVYGGNVFGEQRSEQMTIPTERNL